MAILGTLSKVAVEAFSKATPAQQELTKGAVKLGAAAGLIEATHNSTPVVGKTDGDSIPSLTSSIQDKIYTQGLPPREVADNLIASGVSPYKLSWAMRQATEASAQNAKASGASDEDIFQYYRDAGIPYAAPKIPQAEVDLYDEKRSAVEDIPQPFYEDNKTDDTFNDPMWYHPDVDTAGLPTNIASQIAGKPEEIVKTVNSLASKLNSSWVLPDNRIVNQVKEVTNNQALKVLADAGFPDAQIDEDGVVMVKDPRTGEYTTYEQPWYINLANTVEDYAGEIVGAFAGQAIAEAALPAVASTPMGRITTGVITLSAMALGSSLGRSYDVLNAASKLNLETSSKQLALQMGDAATQNFIIGMGLSSLADAGSLVVKGIKGAYNRFLAGNIDGAFEGLKSATGMNDAQIHQVIQDWEKVTGSSVRSDKLMFSDEFTTADKKTAMKVLSQTEKGTLPSTAAAMKIAKVGTHDFIAQVNKRAQGLRQELDSLTNDNIGLFIQQDLNDYVSKVSNYSSLVRDTGIKEANSLGYRFDYSLIQTAKEFEKRVSKSFGNYKFPNLLARDLENLRQLGMDEAAANVPKSATLVINGQKIIDPKILEQLNPNRSFKDLLDLRDTVVRLSTNKKYQATPGNKEVAEKTLARIDKEIRTTSKNFTLKGWMTSYKKASEEQAKLRSLHQNALFTALTKPGVSPDGVVRAFDNALHSISTSDYMAVLEKLSGKTRTGAEGAVIKNYVTKYTKNFSDKAQAVDFRALDKDLSTLHLVDPDAVYVQKMVHEMASVFKMDPDLLQVLTRAPAATPTNNIAVSAWGKLKMTIATKWFQYGQAIAPTDKAKHMALTLEMRKVFQNPLDAKAIETLKANLQGAPGLIDAIDQYANAFAKFGHSKDYDLVTVHRVAPVGQVGASSLSDLGKGTLYYVDKKQAMTLAKQTGHKRTEKTIPVKALARPSDAEAILGRAPEPADFKDPLFQQKLKQNFSGYTDGNRVLIFK